MSRSPATRREPRWARELRGGHPWLLSSAQRGNEHAGLPARREGNAVRALVDGRCYLPVPDGRPWPRRLRHEF